MAKKTKGGALATDPSAATTINPDRVQARIKFLQKNRPDSAEIKTLQQKLKSAGAGGSQVSTEPVAPPSFGDVTGSANQATENTFNQINDQGDFNPASYEQPFQDLQQQGQDVAMRMFERQNQPYFEKQQADFRQMAAERGWDPTSQAYAQAYKQQVQDPQEAIRAQAQDRGWEMGLGAQNQAFGQSVAQYQMPYNALQAVAPFYGAQNQARMTNAQIAAAWRQAQLNAQTARQTAGAGSGVALQVAQLNNAAAMERLNQGFYNNMVAQGMGGGTQYPSPGTGAATGFGQGGAMAIASGMT